uniref:Uncharacterized protein n=1 Tax=Acrobeloides nanus TaxID=290746 RepID=A0A914EA41_9BILA
MGQIQTFLKSTRGEFERLENSSTPAPKEKKQLDDPRSPTTEVNRTPIETSCSTPAKLESDSPSTHLLSKGSKSLRQRLLERRFLGSERT